ncbi:hypothetical protein [Archangium sp.]|uniref:hypothetical protein n=1 Tax=Archangium sp. TaxID=1872627 RepID=UPI002D68045D|nr:hypothetical protein [Archangium sp.]HYO54564.1 hypothetical protein [Archangium sp.]
MRLFGTIAVGIVALLGSSAHAQLPVVNEARASWQGCAYSLKVLQDADPDFPYYQPLYRISVQSEVVSSATCTLTPRTVELGTSKLTPQIALAANADGLAAAYSFGEYIRGFGNWVRIRIHRLDPSTLGSVKVAGLQGHFVPSNGGAGMPGATSLGELTLHSGYLEVNGTLNGNSITEDPATTPWPYPIVQGSRFVVIYPDFFSQTPQSPRFVTF